MFTRAIVRRPAASLAQGITSATLGAPDIELAGIQHAAYVDALEKCGLAVTVLDAAEDFPDSTFVEDVALLTSACAVSTRPGADSRRGEAELMRTAVGEHFGEIESITAPGTLDAGDVMMVGTHFYIGLSERTNSAGADQLIAILERHGLSGSTVVMHDMLHLKTGLSYLEDDNLLVCGEFRSASLFERFNRIDVPDNEAYAANSVWINGSVLVPAGFPRTLANIEALGYATISLQMSEFQKLDGGLSCLSLRF